MVSSARRDWAAAGPWLDCVAIAPAGPVARATLDASLHQRTGRSPPARMVKFLHQQYWMKMRKPYEYHHSQGLAHRQGLWTWMPLRNTPLQMSPLAMSGGLGRKVVWTLLQFWRHRFFPLIFSVDGWSFWAHPIPWDWWMNKDFQNGAGRPPRPHKSTKSFTAKKEETSLQPKPPAPCFFKTFSCTPTSYIILLHLRHELQWVHLVGGFNPVEKY